jgi:phenylalanyl-tRNA synthetase beta subunit
MSDHPALENFLAAYFHQDWQAEHATPEAVVDYYRDSESPGQVAATRRELGHLLGLGLDEQALGDMLRSAGCEFDPTRTGLGWRDWLSAVHARLEPAA